MTETIRYGLVGKEDIRIGRGTFIATLADGRVVTLNEVDLHQYAEDSGSTDSYAITLDSIENPYQTGMVYYFKANTANTGACTLNINSAGAKTIKKNGSSDLSTGDITASQIIGVVYDGTNMQMLSQLQPGQPQNGSFVYAADAEASDTYVITLDPVPSSLTTGMVIHFLANTKNTGACTLNVNSLGATAIKKNVDQDLENDDIQASQIVTVAYDGTNFQMLSFPSTNLTQSGQAVFAADAGSTDAYAVTLDPAPSAYVTGMFVHFTANTVNTGAATLNVNSLGAKTIVKHYDVTLDNGDIKAGQAVSVIYDGTNFQMLSEVGARDIGCRVTTTANLTISNNSITTVAFDAERWDTDTMHDTSTNNNRITFNTAGKYSVGFSGEWAADVNGERHAMIRVNGSTPIVERYDNAITGASLETHTVLSTVYSFSSGDYIEVRVFQNSGGSLDLVDTGFNSIDFWAQRIS